MYKKSICFVLLLTFGGVMPVAAEEGKGALASYDVKAAKTIAKQAVALLDAGKYKEAKAFLMVYSEQYSEDNDINFLLGQSCSMLEQYPQAIAYYQKVLSRNQEVPRVRLELGRAYAANGQKKEARQEFNRVLASSPPPLVAQHVKQFLTQMDAQKNAQIKLSLSYFYDSNANAGPDNAIQSDFGFVYQTGGSATKESDMAQTAGLSIDYFKALSATAAWQTGMHYNRTAYRTVTSSNWDEMSFYTGPIARSGDVTYSLPFSVRLANVGSERYSYIHGITPQVQYQLKGNRERIVSVDYQSREFFTNESRNGNAWTCNVAERFNLNQEKSRFIEVGGGLGRENAREEWLSNDTSNVYVTYYSTLEKGLSLLVRPSISWHHYKDIDVPAQFFGSPDKRKDGQYNVQVNLIKTDKNYNYILGYVYTRNHSNINLYSYNRSMVSLQVAKLY